MRFSVPHPIPYQGSKRRLAKAILSHAPKDRYARLIEPFAGSAAITLAAAQQNIISQFVLSDRLEPLAQLWQGIIDNPADIAETYECLWQRERALPIDEYYSIRREFNMDRDPAKLLYLLVRCVKNAVRFNPAGEFNQSPDKRRTGTRPEVMSAELYAAHRVLAGRTEVFCGDFMESFQAAAPGDLFYLDPPYQGTSGGRDQRYIEGVTRERMIEGISLLNEKHVPFILSYDGFCGDRTYGDRLPTELASRVLLDVGRSSQATLNGRDHTTIESLYLSREFGVGNGYDAVMTLQDFDAQQSMIFS